MATTCGKAARRQWGTKAAAKRAIKSRPKEFGDSPETKAKYRELKRQKRQRRKNR